MTWAEIWESVQHFFATSGINVARALLLWIVGYIVVRLVVVVVKKIFQKSKMEKVAQGFIVSIIRFALHIILIIMVLQALGVEITGIVAALATAGLAIGLALKDSLGNVASGVILLITKPFKEGDFVKVDGVEGKVKNIKIFTTALVTLDNKLVVLPNSAVVNNPLTNFSNRKTRRVDYTFSVAYESDVELVRKVVLDVMKSDGRVLLDPEPKCRICNFNESSVDFFAFCWCDSDDYWDVYYYIWDNVFNEFKRNNISIPYKQVEVRMREDKVVMPYRAAHLQERVEKIRSHEKIRSIDHFFDQLEDGEIDAKTLKEQSKKAKKERQEKKEKKKQQELEKKKNNKKSKE